MPHIASPCKCAISRCLSRCKQRAHKYQRALINPKYRAVWYENAPVNFGARERSRVSTYKSDAQCRLGTISRRGAVSLNHGRSCVSCAQKKVGKGEKIKKKNCSAAWLQIVSESRSVQPGVTVRKLRVFKSDIGIFPKSVVNISSNFCSFSPSGSGNAGPCVSDIFDAILWSWAKELGG